jgi:phage tail sheath gpL-like
MSYVATNIGAYGSGFLRFCLNPNGNNVAAAGKPLYIGQMLASGSAVPGNIYAVYSVAQAFALFGAGSVLADAVAVHVGIDNTDPVYCAPVADPTGGAAAVFEWTITAANSAAGTIYVQINGTDYTINLPFGATIPQIVADIVAVIGADTTLPYTVASAGAPAASVTFTAKHEGTVGNCFAPIFNPYFGEALPAGLTITQTQMTPGAGVPSIAAAISAVGACNYDGYALLYEDEASVQALVTLLNSATGRWACSSPMGFGQAYRTMTGATNNLQTTVDAIAAYGNSLSQAEQVVIPIPYGLPIPSWRFAAAWCSRTVVAATADPARPVVRDNGFLTGLTLASKACMGVWTQAMKEELVNAGVSVWEVSNTLGLTDTTLWIEENITNWKFNALGQPDITWQQVSTRYQVPYFVNALSAFYWSNFTSVALVNNGTSIPAGRKAVTPNVVQARLKAFVRNYTGVVIDAADNLDSIIQVSRDTDGQPPGQGDSNRIDVAINPHFLNQLLRIATSVGVNVRAN